MDGVSLLALATVCAGALRPNRVAKATAARALNWVVRQVSFDSLRSPALRISVETSSKLAVESWYEYRSWSRRGGCGGRGTGGIPNGSQGAGSVGGSS